ncbi:homoserine dehydrogenase [Zavarzinia sp. CC-PAN008]|uniref:homoserine dehydrogenase n=1 Tax=Zavarzinia sp. CC-PAN008 TaxID=3243332 RepID=UPI003F74270D
MEPGKDVMRIGVAGLGTVGTGLLKLIAAHGDRLAQRCGRRLVVTAVSARDRAKARDVVIGADVTWHADPVAIAADPRVDVVVELIGGSDGPAHELVKAALQAGKPVVTANKALLAHHGTELAALAEARGVSLNFEAAIAGGIPIVKALREGLAGNGIERVAGILNGTSNYILTHMAESGRPFADVLAEAQDLGYAEADPSFDVDGVDAAHKLSLLASLAFGTAVDFDGVAVEGIRAITPLDIAYARELGFRIKLLGLARPTSEGIEARVHPCLVPEGQALAHVDGVFNAVVVAGDFVDQMVFEGRGAGQGPTASAVAADLVDIAHGLVLPPFGVPSAALRPAARSPIANREGPYYLRLRVLDRPGVIADIAAILRDEAVSIESLLQRGRATESDDGVAVVMVTHETPEWRMIRAAARIADLSAVLEKPVMIRIETLEKTQ